MSSPATASSSPAHQTIDGGPSVLYDAIAILASADGAAALAADPAAKDFVTDAHAHSKFVAYHPDAEPLLDAAGVVAELDDGYVALDSHSAPSTFLQRCRGAPLLGPGQGAAPRRMMPSRRQARRPTRPKPRVSGVAPAA